MAIRILEVVVAAAVAALLVAFAVELWRGPRPTFEEHLTVPAPSAPVARCTAWPGRRATRRAGRAAGSVRPAPRART